MFTRPVHEPLHGIGHIYRTMIACALLAQRLRMPRSGLIAFCGAYIHDLGRTNDFIDNEHGMNAVNWHFDKYSELWEKYAAILMNPTVWEASGHTAFSKRMDQTRR